MGKEIGSRQPVGQGNQASDWFLTRLFHSVVSFFIEVAEWVGTQCSSLFKSGRSSIWARRSWEESLDGSLWECCCHPSFGCGKWSY